MTHARLTPGLRACYSRRSLVTVAVLAVVIVAGCSPGGSGAVGRPVGLLVWRGAHSWVLHGFSASADPALTDDYAITGLWVSDPWYPRVSSIWGPSRKPNQRITVKQLREDYLRWRRPTGRYPGMDGQYVLVLPMAGAT